MAATGDYQPIANVQHGAMLPPGGAFTGPHANVAALLRRAAGHRRDHVAAPAAVISPGAMLAPGAAAGAAILAQRHIVFLAGGGIQHFVPVGPYLPHLMFTTFLLYVFGVGYLGRHDLLLSPAVPKLPPPDNPDVPFFIGVVKRKFTIVGADQRLANAPGHVYAGSGDQCVLVILFYGNDSFQRAF